MAVSDNSVYYIEIIASDVNSACDFYAKSYGWKFRGAVPELGDARVADLPDGSRCGIRAPMHDQEKATARLYVKVKDIDATVKTAKENGATIALEPVEIPEHGKIAIYIHGGIEQGLWQVS